MRSHVRRIDSQLDRLQLAGLPSTAEPYQATTLTNGAPKDPQAFARVDKLQSLIKSLSSGQSRAGLVQLRQVQSCLQQASVSAECNTCLQHSLTEEGPRTDYRPEPVYEHELEWLLISKATVQTYGHILNLILEQTIPLSDEIAYWNDILGSYRYAGLYTLQTSPLRLWSFTKDVYRDVQHRRAGLANGWRQFYNLVGEVVHERSIADIHHRVMSPIAQTRGVARKQQAALKRIRQVNANALGVLLGEALDHENLQPDPSAQVRDTDTEIPEKTDHKWKSSVAKSIALMEAVLSCASDQSLPADKFNEMIAETTEADSYYQKEMTAEEQSAGDLRPSNVVDRLQNVINKSLPRYANSFNSSVKPHSRPSALLRYWPLATFAFVSGSTILRIVANRRAEILTWVREFGQTCIDFWQNWVVDPTRKVIATIRHDEGSEISIMSKRSLESDRASLEQMVVDFAVQNPESGRTLNESQIAELRASVKEGDLSPVLKAYEKDMQSPIMGAIRGNLIRTLLIQVQKTKVDVELAMSGIDSMLKSQELLFGFIGLTPGVIVTIGAFSWLRSTMSSRAGLRTGQKRGALIQSLRHVSSGRLTRPMLISWVRNIDRILVAATPTEFGELTYKDHGLLLCEAHLLRQKATRSLPRKVINDLIEDIDELVDIRSGVDRQRKVVERIAWAYTKWLN